MANDWKLSYRSHCIEYPVADGFRNSELGFTISTIGYFTGKRLRSKNEIKKKKTAVTTSCYSCRRITVRKNHSLNYITHHHAAIIIVYNTSLIVISFLLFFID